MSRVFEGNGWKVINGRWQDSPPAECDVVIADPPYSEHVHSKSRRGGELAPRLKGNGKPAHGASISRERDLGFDAITMREMLQFAAIVSKICRRWVLVFSDQESTHLWRKAFRRVGDLEHIRTGAWVKEGSTPQFTGDRPADAVECINIFHRKGRKRWNGGGRHALWTHPIVLNRSHTEPRLHETQKPISLMLDLVRDFSEPGELIWDGYGGSMTTGLAALSEGRRILAHEMRAHVAQTGAERLQAAEQGLSLTAARAGQIPLFGGQR